MIEDIAANSVAFQVMESWRMSVALENVTQPQQNFPDIERFGDVVVGAVFQSDHSIKRLIAPGDHDNRKVSLGADFLRDFQTTHLTKPKIERYQVNRILCEAAHCLIPVSGLEDFEAFVGQRSTQHSSHSRFVVDDQNARPDHLLPSLKATTRKLPSIKVPSIFESSIRPNGWTGLDP
jgi:hypothetical protein